MKKFRGQRRYFQSLYKLKNYSGLDFSSGSNSWFDLWHTHFDWKGLGNNSWRKRKPHLDCLINNFDPFAENLKKFKKPFHLFAIIQEYDNSQDAIYIHTPNPNQDNFPFSLEASTTSNFKNLPLQNFLDSLTEFEKLYTNYPEENCCIIYKKGTGQAFQIKAT